MKKIIILVSLLSLSFLFASCNEANDSAVNPGKVKTGAEILVSTKFDLIKGKNLGIVTNHTAVLPGGIHLVDSLHKLNEVSIKALFGPEHGIRGNAPAGEVIVDGKDKKTGIQVYSLYGEIRKPTKEMLKDVDLLIFDIQDIGARFYTYISTLFYTIEAAAENDISLLVLDRPNPINGVDVEGPVVEEELYSFVGIAPIPIRHGMTGGELAKFFNEENLIDAENSADLKIVKMENWNRTQYFDECGLEWLKPSPNMPDLETAIVYPGTCFLEGSNLSEGRGTYEPFLKFGAPFINSEKLIDKLNELNTNGISFKPVTFTPKPIPKMSSRPKYKGEECSGIKLSVKDREKFAPVTFGVKLLYALYHLYPEKVEFNSYLDKLFGETYLRQMLNDGKDISEILSRWENETKEFKEVRKKYLQY